MSEVRKRAVKHRNNRTASCRLTGKFPAVCALVRQWKRRCIHRQRHSAMEDSKSERSLQEGVKHRNNRTASCRLTGKFSAVCPLVRQWKRRRIHRQSHSALRDSKRERSLQEGVKHRNNRTASCTLTGKFSAVCPLVRQWKRRCIHRQRHSALRDSKNERSLQEGVKHRNNRTASCRLTGKFSAVCPLVRQWKRRRIHRQRHSALRDSKNERSLQEGVKHRNNRTASCTLRGKFSAVCSLVRQWKRRCIHRQRHSALRDSKNERSLQEGVKHRNNRTASCRLTGKFSAVCALERQWKRRCIHRQRHSALRDSKRERSLQEGSETQKQQNSKLQTHRQIFSCVCPRTSVETAVYP